MCYITNITKMTKGYRKKISVSFSYDIQGGEPMNISKFTQKSVQAVQDLEKVAYEYGNQEVEQEHLLYAC